MYAPPKLETDKIFYFVDKRNRKTVISSNAHKSSVVGIYGVRAAKQTGYVYNIKHEPVITFEYLDTHEHRGITQSDCQNPNIVTENYEQAFQHAVIATMTSHDECVEKLGIRYYTEDEITALVTKHSTAAPAT